jgi:hypothetical protein
MLLVKLILHYFHIFKSLSGILPLPPIHTYNIVMGQTRCHCFGWYLVGECGAFVLGAKNTLEPIVTLVQSKTTQFTLKKTLSPWML